MNRSVSLTTAKFIFLLCLSIGTAPLLAQYQNTLQVNVNFKILQGTHDNSYLVIENLTTGLSQTIKGTTRFNLQLPFHSEFILSFHKPGYVTKRIQIDTRVPQDRLKQGFYPIHFDVYLFRQYEGVNIVVFNQPVAKYQYNRLLDEIFYDTDYTKQIQSAVWLAEEELKQKGEEEQRQTTRLKAEAEKEKADSIARQRAQQKARADSIAATRDQIRAQAMEERKQRLKEQQEKRRQITSAANREDRTIARMQSGSEKQQLAHLATEEQQRQQSSAPVRMEERERTMAVMKAENDRRSQRQAPARHSFEPHSIKHSANPLPGIIVEEVNESNRSVIHARVTYPHGVVTYRKITYQWGGVFYFKDRLSISETMFRQATGLK
jgi:hypothetical protein